MFQNILVTLDCSSHSESALMEAIDLARAAGGRLTMLACIPHPPSWACTPVSAAALPALSEELRRDAEQNLRCAVDRVPTSVPVTTILSPDPIRKALACELKRGCHDLLVVGAHGAGPVGGGIANYARKHASIAVLLVHAEQTEAAPSDVQANNPVPAADPRSDPLPATG